MASVSSQQGKNSGPGIIDIRGNIEKIFSKPPEPYSCGKGIPCLEQKNDYADKGDEKLSQRTAQ